MRGGYDQGIHLTAEDLGASITPTLGGTPGVIEVSMLGLLAIQIVWEGAAAPVGDFTTEFSVDGTTWEVKDTQTAGGGAGSVIYDYATSAPYWRVKYARTSGGSGDTVTVKWYAKA